MINHLPNIPELLRDWPTPWRRHYRDILAGNDSWIMDCASEVLGDKIVELANYAGEMKRIAETDVAVVRELPALQLQRAWKEKLNPDPTSLDRETFMRLMAEFINNYGTMTAKGPLERAFESMFGTTVEKFK